MNHWRTGLPRSIALILAVVFICNGCGRPPEVTLDGSDDVRLLVRLDLDRIASEIEKRAESSDKNLDVTLDWRTKIGLNAVTLMLIQGQEDGGLEFIATIPDASRDIWNGLAATNLPYLEFNSNDDGTLSPKVDALIDADTLPDNLPPLVMKWHQGQILVGSAQRLGQIESGSWDVQHALANQVFERVITADSLIAVATLVPEELDFDLKGAEQVIRESESIKSIPPVGRMVLALATAGFESVRDSLHETEAVALAVSLSETDERRVRYAQLFRDRETAEAVYEDVESSCDGDGIASSVAELLHDESINHRVSRSGRLIEIEGAWAKVADQRVASSAQRVVQSVLAGAMGFSSEPTKGPIQTRYAMPPHLVKLPAKDMQATIAQYLRSQVFPGWVNDQGDEPSMQLELDTLALPNGQLTEGTYEVVAVMTADGKDVVRLEEGAAQDQSLQLSHPGTCFLKIPIRPGTDKTQLKSARLQFSLKVPTSVDVLEFSAGDVEGTKKKIGKQWAKVKRIERDVAEVAFRAPAPARLFAFDKTGRPLASRESMRGGSAISVRFSGVVERLWVALPSNIEQLAVNVEADLNGGEALRLPDKPSNQVPVRYDASSIEDYASIDEKELSSLAVDVQSTPGFADRECLALQMPRVGQGVKADWELYWFAKDRPITVPGFSYSQNGQLAWSSQNGLGEATAVDGWAKVVVPTNFERLEFAKGEDGSWQSKRVGTETVKIRIDRNQISYKTGDLKVMDVAAMDVSRRRLKTEFGNQSDGAISHLVWGQPVRVELVVSGKTIEKVVEVSIVREGTDPTAFAAYKRQIPKYHRTLAAMMQIERAVRKAPYGYDEIAGLHYLHDRKRKPLQLIPTELAHACPQGADRFGYEPQPFSGYYFERLPQQSQRNPPSGKPRVFRWSKGEFEVPPSGNRNLVAIPQDKNHPTFFVRWGTTYMKFLGGQRLQAVPTQPRAEGWSEVSFIQTPMVPDSLALSR